jgi:hypothetical protein
MERGSAKAYADRDYAHGLSNQKGNSLDRHEIVEWIREIFVHGIAAADILHGHITWNRHFGRLITGLGYKVERV